MRRASMSRTRPKSRNAHAPVGAQQVVARMRVAERDAVAVEQAEEEAEDDLAVAVALRLVRARTASNRSPSTYSETSTRRVERSVRTRGTEMNGCPRHQPLDAPLVLGLELVVELLADPLAQLGDSALASRPGASRLTSGSSSVALRRSVSTASATPGYCTFTATSSPSTVVARWTWPIEAAANARSSNSANTSPSGAPSSLRRSFSRRSNGTGGTPSRRVASLRCSSSRCSSAGRRSRPSRASARPSWPRRASCRAGRRARRRARWCARRSAAVGPLRRPHAVGGAHPRPAHALAGHQPADPRRPRDPARRQLPRLFRRMLGVRPHTLRLATVSAAAGRRRAR